MPLDPSFLFQPHAGLQFTQSIHSKPEGPTIPENNKVTKQPFTVCVTGAGKGIGYWICLAYARAGVTGIVISSRTQSDLDKLSAELKKINPKLHVVSQICDTTKDSDVAALAEATKKEFGYLDVCVANAGIISKYLPDGTLPSGILADDDFTRVIDINFLGAVRTARCFAPLLLDKKSEGAFIVISSIAAHLPASDRTPIAYNTSKIAVNRLIEHLKNDYGHDGLLAYAVHPGAALTPQTEHHSLEKGDQWEQGMYCLEAGDHCQ